MDSESREPAPHVPDEWERKVLLRRALASALRAGRHEALVDAEAATTQRKPPQIGAALAIALVFWFPAATAGERLNISVGWWPLLAVALAIGMGVGVKIPHTSNAWALTVILAAPASLALQLDDHREIWLTHVAPTAAALMLALLTRSVDVRSARDIGVAAAVVARSAPLLVPLSLVVLVLPAVNADVWQVAARLDVGDVVLLLVLTVAPLYGLVLRQLFSEIPVVLESRAQRLADQGAGANLTRNMLRQRLTKPVAKIVLGMCTTEIGPAWPSHPKEYGPIIAAAEGNALRRPMLARLAVCVLIVALLSSTFLYAVLATVIDVSVARDWTNAEVPVSVVHAAGMQLIFPGGIYIQVVALLGALATAIFLAFALLEERFSTALGDSLVRLPADRLLALCIPYLSLREQRIARDDDRGDDVDPGLLDQGGAESSNGPQSTSA